MHTAGNTPRFSTQLKEFIMPSVKKKKKRKTEEGVAPLYLYFAHFARAVHPAGHVDSVPPDVVLRFPSPNDPGYHGAVVYPCTEDDRAVS